MFKFAKKREVLWPVTISVPQEDGSGAAQVEIKVRYKLLTQTELEQSARDECEMLNSIKSDDLEALMDSVSAEKAAARRADLLVRITGWEGVQDADSGEPLPFNADNCAALLEVPYVFGALQSGLKSASRGAAVKN